MSDPLATGKARLKGLPKTKVKPEIFEYPAGLDDALAKRDIDAVILSYRGQGAKWSPLPHEAYRLCGHVQRLTDSRRPVSDEAVVAVAYALGVVSYAKRLNAAVDVALYLACREIDHFRRPLADVAELAGVSLKTAEKWSKAPHVKKLVKAVTPGLRRIRDGYVSGEQGAPHLGTEWIVKWDDLSVSEQIDDLCYEMVEVATVPNTRAKSAIREDLYVLFRWLSTNKHVATPTAITTLGYLSGAISTKTRKPTASRRPSFVMEDVLRLLIRTALLQALKAAFNGGEPPQVEIPSDYKLSRSSGVSRRSVTRWFAKLSQDRLSELIKEESARLTKDLTET